MLAPGKLFLAGEYAVLEGGVAVLAAVSRFALAQFVPGVEPSSPIVAESVARARAALGEAAGALPEGSAQVDTAGFSLDGVKLGLGSSAAVAVAAAGAVLEHAGVSLISNRQLLFAVADAAHRASQGGVGSGADVATAVHGGFVRFLRVADGAPVITPLLPPAGLEMVVFWTRAAARTTDLIAGVRHFADGSPHEYAGHREALRLGADRFAEAFGSADPRGVVQAGDAYHEALLALGRAAGLPIVTDATLAAVALARALGGSAKSSGAGGGDVGVAFFADAEAAAQFATRCPPEVLVLDIRLGAPGAYRRLPSGVETFKID